MDKEKVIKKLKQGAPLTSALVVAACIGVSLSGYQPPVYEAQAQTKETKKADTDKDSGKAENVAKGSFDLADGIYKGTGTGYAGEITVAVTIKDKQITAIDILSSSDDAAFFNRAKTVIDRIIAGQTLDVDVVSGATYSSNGIISAVKNALTGEKDSGETGASQSGNSAAEGSTLALADVADAAAYRDGTYYGTGTGFGGAMKVKVVINGGKISSIDIVENHDDSSYLNRAKALINNIIATQSTNVDIVSGATYSSNGIKSAVRDALRQAAVSGSSASTETSADSSNTTEEDNASVPSGNFPYKEGIYYGTAEGYNGDIEVAVVLQDKSIKAVLVTKNNDDERFFNRAMDVVKNVMKKQSTDVDVVSGATYSSNGLLNAVKNALKEAEKATNGQTAEPAVKEADTSELEKVMDEARAINADDYTEATFAVLKTRIEDAQKFIDADKTEITQEEVDQALKNLNQALALLEKKDNGSDEDNTVYKNGIYEGRALCLPDEDEDFAAYNLTLKITVRNDKIVAITDVKGDGDVSNDSYITRAANGTSVRKGVIAQVIEKGSTEDIDVVSRATCSSKAILEACDNALISAKNSK